MYYLETNSLRILANKLKRAEILDNCYTSLLSICEILSGINDDSSWIERKGILTKVFISNIKTDLDLPETKLYKAYDIQINSKIPDSILLIGGLLMKSQSYADFLDKIIQSYLAEYWAFLRIYDKNSDGFFKESFKDRQSNFDYSDPNLIPNFNNRWDNLTDNPSLKLRILNDLIVYFAETHLKSNSVIKVNKSLEDLVKSYDHSLDIFYISIGYFTGTKILFKNAPSRNDYFDLNHLTYLRNRTDIIVSNDKMVIKIMKKLHPDNILSTTDLEDIFKK